MNPYEFLEEDQSTTFTDVVLRFKNVTDEETLKIDIEMLLESVSEDGIVLYVTEV